MRIPGRTPLEDLPGLPGSLRESLRELWIASVEDFLGLLAAIERIDPLERGLKAASGVIQATRTAAFDRVSSTRRAELSRSRAARPLGCRLDPRLFGLYEREGRVARAPEAPPEPFAGALPREVRLFQRLLPAKDQGERGTCVAFACVALREFLAGEGMSLSEQFLYWACKELDGWPGPGTYLHTGMTALANYGVCEGATWPYVPTRVERNEGQGPPPEGAIEEARRYRLPNARTVEPGLLDQYRRILAGGTDGPGMPVTFATLVFGSWLRSPETHRTGKITMPFPGERPEEGGHAWCAVGYVDDEDVPGGGYFIVRNSWGTDWAPDSPEAPGHALMPYAYVARFTVEAFTGPAKAVPDRAADDDEFAPYLRRLAEEGRDVDGRLLPAGTPVLCHPEAPGEFREDAPESRVAFRERDFTWTEGTRSRIWFRPRALEREAARRTRAASLAKRSFREAIEGNLRASAGAFLPDSGLGLRHIIVAPFPTIRGIRENPIDPDPLLRRLEALAGWPPDLESADYDAFLRETTCLASWDVRSLRRRVRVGAAFLCPHRFASPGRIELLPAGPEHIRAVVEAFEDRKGTKGDGVCPRFLILGSATGWEDEAATDGGSGAGAGLRGDRPAASRATGSESRGVGPAASRGSGPGSGDGPAIAGDGAAVRTSADRLLITCSMQPDGAWPPGPPSPDAVLPKLILHFLPRLWPLTDEELAGRIRPAVEEAILLRGAAVRRRLAEEIGVSPEAVMRAWRCMVGRGYRARFEPAIGDWILEQGKGRPPAAQGNWLRRWWLRVLAGGAAALALGVAGGQLGLTRTAHLEPLPTVALTSFLQAFFYVTGNYMQFRMEARRRWRELLAS